MVEEKFPFDKSIVYDEMFFNIEGKECVDGETCFLKRVGKKSEQIDSTSHYILFKGGVLVDPFGDDCSLRNLRDYTFKRVHADCFKFYLKYLKTRIVRHLSEARRKQNG